MPESRLPIVTVLSLLVMSTAMATTIHVPGSATSIQAGINLAVAGDTVLVAPGTYVGAGNCDIDFAGKAVALMSSGGASVTTVNCEGAARGVRFHSQEDTTTIVSGFTIQAGYSGYSHGGIGGGILCELGSSPKIADCVITGCDAKYYGGGVGIDDSSPVLDAVVLTYNTSIFGGGISINNDSLPVVRNTTVHGNEVDGSGGGICCWNGSDCTIVSCTITSNSALTTGGGFDCDGSSPALTDVVFSDNSANSGGAMSCAHEPSPLLARVDFLDNVAYLNGGGLRVQFGSSPVLIDCGFVGNQAAGSGGGMWVSTNTVFSLPVLSDCDFQDNKAWGAAPGGGGGLYIWTTAIDISDCLFVGNEAVGYGGGLYCNMNTRPSITNSTFDHNEAAGRGGAIYGFGPVEMAVSFVTMVGNSAEDGGGMYCTNGADGDITKSIIAFNAGGGATACFFAAPTFRYCSVFANAGGDDLCGTYSDILSVDPRLCGVSSGDYTLCADSPCLAGNNTWGYLIGAHPQGCSSCGSPVHESSWGLIKAMYR